MDDVSLLQLQAISMILQLPTSRNREELTKQIQRRLRAVPGTAAVQRVKSRSQAASRSRTVDTNKSREQSRHQQKDSFKNAIESVASRGYTQVVAALVNNGKRWFLLRKPNSERMDDRVTIWGNAEGGARKLYGGNTMTDKEFVESKLRMGYERDASMLRVARNLTRGYATEKET